MIQERLSVMILFEILRSFKSDKALVDNLVFNLISRQSMLAGCFKLIQNELFYG